MDIRAYTLRNATDTAEKAPYIYRVIPNGVANTNDLVSDLLKRVAGTDGRVRMIVNEALKVAIEHCRKGETVDFGPFRLKPHISGSTPYEDSPFDEAANAFILDFYIDEELRDTFDGFVPRVISGKEIGSLVKVSNVMDVGTQEFGVVYGSNPFEILGNGVTLDGEGESVKAISKKTGEVVGTATVMSVSKGQRATCKFAPALPAGDYTFKVTTYGIAGDTTPHVFSKSVKVVAAKPTPAKPPKVTLICADDREGEPEYADKLVEGQGVHFFGENLAGVTSLKMQYCKASDGNPHDKVIDLGLISYDGTSHLTLGTDFWSDGWADDWDRGSSCRFTLTTASGTVTHDAYAHG